MNSKIRRLPRLALVLAAGLILASASVYAQEDERPEQKTKEAQAVSKEVYDKIQQAQEQVDANDYQAALRTLDALRRGKLTEYELSNVLNYIGFVYYNMEEVGRAIETYEELLRIPSLEEQMKKQTLYTMAQLSTMQEEYREALRYLDQWFAMESNPPPEPYILYAQNLYQVDRYGDMIEPIERAMEIARSRDVPIKEDWYVLLNFAYFQQENYAMVRDIHKILLQNWPKKRYWFTLAGAYTELGEDQNLVAAYDAAHTQGLLTTESELVTMAQLYMQQEVPYKAAQLLETELERGRVEKNEKNYRLLSQAWSLAMEDEKAIPALEQAARRSDDGEMYVRLANSHLNLGQYRECADAAREGLQAGDLKSPDNAQISLGMCLYNLGEYEQAINAFTAAAKTERSRRVSRQWIDVIRADIERNKQIRQAELNAQKQQRELERRLATRDRGI
ncbi:MAG: tetratricopeptide repeat protein [Woeseia sp.]